MAVGTVALNHMEAPIATWGVEGSNSQISEARLHELGQQQVEMAQDIISTGVSEIEELLSND